MKLSCNTRPIRSLRVAVATTMVALLSLMPISTISNTDIGPVPIPEDECPVDIEPTSVTYTNGGIQLASVRPCRRPPAPQVIPNQKCHSHWVASCQRIPCRCALYCVQVGGSLLCVPICEEFNTNAIQFPRCRPAQGQNCPTTARECGEFVKYIGPCGGISFGSMSGWISTCN